MSVRVPRYETETPAPGSSRGVKSLTEGSDQDTCTHANTTCTLQHSDETLDEGRPGWTTYPLATQAYHPPLDSARVKEHTLIITGGPLDRVEEDSKRLGRSLETSEHKALISADELQQKYSLLKELGLDLGPTLKCRTQSECDELVKWATRPETLNAISKDGKLDFTAPPSHPVTCSIETISDAPFKAHPIKADPKQKAEILRQVEEKLDQGIIERSSAPWSSNCVCINKNGKTRIAVDYRKLNKVTKKDNYLLPTVQEIMDCLEGTHWFTSVDACQAYHQIPMATEKDKDLTTFVVPGGGLYRYRYMPFGLTNAGAVWTRFIDNVLHNLRWNICLVYADDILIHTKSVNVQDHIRDLELVFDRLNRYNIKVKADKIRLGLRELPFLGQLVGEGGIRPDPDKTKAITDIPAPKTVHDLRRAMGMFTYYRKYIKNFAHIASPLYEMCGKNAHHKREKNRDIILSDEARRSFVTLKSCLTTEPIMLHYPKWDTPFEVHCDASNLGLGAKLCQKIDGLERVVMYASKALSDKEKKYLSYEKEALALVWSLELFRHYLKFQAFKVITDCRSLIFLKDKAINARVGRWMLRLQEFEFTIKHKAGALLNDVDPLSRSPLESDNPYKTDPIEDLYDTTINDDDGKIIFDAARKAFATEGHEQKCFVNALFSKDTTRPASSTKSDPVVTSFFGVTDVEGWSLDDWIREQRSEKDKDMVRLFHHIKENPDTLHYRQTSEGLLLKRDKKIDHDNNVMWIERYIVPLSLRAFVLRLHHNMPLHAHQGSKRLYKMLSKKFYWPKMLHDSTMWVKSCLPCAKRKTSRNWNQGLTEPVLAQQPFEVVGIDLVGKCLKTTTGNKWIVTIVDHFSRWPIAIPIPNRKATTIAECIYKNLVCEHGIPLKILSDQGQELIGSALKYLYQRWGIKPAQTGGYNPQANGACERFHRWLNVTMTQLYDRKTPDWDEYLPALCFAYRVSINDATGHSPYYILRGREATLPADAIFQPSPKLTTENEEHRDDYVSKMTERLHQAFGIARNQQYKAYLSNRENSEARYRPNFEVGDRVLVWKRTSKDERLAISGDKRALPSKWRNPWSGPGVVTRKISNTMCEVELEGDKSPYNYNRLTKYTPWDSVHESTHVWASSLKPSNQERHVASNFQESSTLEAGDLILFRLSNNSHSNTNYGVANVISITNDGYIHFQWLGNVKNSTKSKFQPGWIDNDENEYYQRKPLHRSHKPFTGTSTETYITINTQMIRHRDTKIIDKLGHLTQAALSVINSFSTPV